MNNYLLKKISECKQGSKVKVFNGGKEYICTIEEVEFEYFRTNYIKELDGQFRLYFNEYGTYWKLLDDNEEIVNESLKAFDKIIELCNRYQHEIVKDTEIQTVCGYPIDNIRKDLEMIGIIKSIPSMGIALYNACDTEKYFTHKEKREKIKEWLER